jgi:hypothetical protein
MNARRLALKALYWLAVLVVSLVIVFLLVLLFESLDDSSVDQGSVILPLLGRSRRCAAPRHRRARTTPKDA